MTTQGDTMTLGEMVARIKKHPRICEAGMILCHNGIVRGTSRDGRKVKKIKVEVDQEALTNIVSEIKSRPGIIEVLAEINEGTLKVGEDIMLVVVAGDIRERVFPTLQDLVQQIKQRITEKEECT